MAEMEFLNENRDKKGTTLLYAGAAPGTHVKKLSALFPDVKFVLVDPAPFTVKETDRIRCRQELFTDEVAKEYAGRDDVLFISDIRSSGKHGGILIIGER